MALLTADQPAAETCQAKKLLCLLRPCKAKSFRKALFPKASESILRHSARPFFATASRAYPNGAPKPTSAAGRCLLAAPAAPPARHGGLRKRRAARRGVVMRGLDMQVKMGEDRVSGVSGRQGLGTTGLKTLREACGGDRSAGQHAVQTRSGAASAADTLPCISQLCFTPRQLTPTLARTGAGTWLGGHPALAASDASAGGGVDGLGVEFARGAPVSRSTVVPTTDGLSAYQD
jgi:hypothetical protein